MELIQTSFPEVWLPVECAWNIGVLLPKGDREFRIIGLVKIIWKTVLGIVNHWIGAAVRFHDILHGFWSGQGKGTISFESKLLQNRMAMR